MSFVVLLCGRMVHVFNFTDLCRISTEEEAQEWCRVQGLLPRVMECPLCGEVLYLTFPRREKYGRFTCQKKIAGHEVYGLFYLSAANNTFFSQCRLSTRRVLVLIYSFALEFSYLQTIGVCKERHIRDISRTTISDWFSFLREVCRDFGLKAKQFVNNGHLVPDEIMLSLITNEVKGFVNSNWILDGFPRTKKQAEILQTLEPVHVALNLIVPFDVIIERVKGRWIHEPSGRIYNVEFNPPKVVGKDDVTGEDLIQRPDDQPEAVSKRLHVYSENISPVLEFYSQKEILKDFKGNTSNEIWPQIYRFLTNYMQPKFLEGIALQ